VVRVVGTYTIGAELSILIYPVAEYNLETFLDRLITRDPVGLAWKTMLRALPKFIGCLVNAMAYIHDRMTKHMDIKPKNLLVRHICVPNSGPSHDGGGPFGYKIYIADFGIARSYATPEDMETDGPTMFTRKYAAPEVVDRGPKGRPADIFSLGCVFVEIYATWLSAIQIRHAHVCREGAAHGIKEEAESENTPLSKLEDLLLTNSYGDSSYQANIDAVQSFLTTISEKTGLGIREMAKGMILDDPAERLTAAHLLDRVGTASCCKAGSDRLEAARWREVEIEEAYNMMNGTRSLLSVSQGA
jgi:serine/threonine protein kinase